MSSNRPSVVAFDVVGTVFSLEILRTRLRGAGAPGQLLETWVAETLRDAFALDAVGIYKPFKEVASATLQNLIDAPDPVIEHIVGGFAELDTYEDAGAAMQTLRDADVHVVGLTNGSQEVTQALWQRAGLTDLVERTISIDEVGHWKPRAEVYLHCARTMGVAPERVALIAAHSWDIQGARRAGFCTGFVQRGRARHLSVMESPRVSGSSLLEVARALVAR